MREDELTHQFNYDQYQDGKIDELIRQDDKISMLIYGSVGSRKSTTAIKIEEYLWISSINFNKSVISE